MKIPTPKYVIFYNGEKDAQEIEKLKLSDAFMEKGTEGEYEWTATMYNLNPGNNDELIQNCKPLKEYMQFVLRIRELLKQNYPVEDAVDDTVDYCIANNILESVLLSHKAEVKDMCITEYNEEIFLNGIREEAREEARAEERITNISAILLKGGSEEQAKMFLDATDDEIKKARDIMAKK